jgi:hypothetical protein
MRPVKLLTRSAVVLALLLLTPLTFSAEDGVHENQVCSKDQPDCQREIDSVCTAGPKPVLNYYTKAGE